jgi:alpha-L-rhamnosidase
MCFRRTVTIADPAQVPALRIAADSKYWLWVNGALVVREGALKRGPNRSDTWLDVVDVRAQLRSGANTIAVLVWYWGKHGFAHWSSGRGGLLIDGGAALSTDAQWRACVRACVRASGVCACRRSAAELSFG